MLAHFSTSRIIDVTGVVKAATPQPARDDGSPHTRVDLVDEAKSFDFNIYGDLTSCPHLTPGTVISIFYAWYVREGAKGHLTTMKKGQTNIQLAGDDALSEKLKVVAAELAQGSIAVEKVEANKTRRDYSTGEEPASTCGALALSTGFTNALPAGDIYQISGVLCTPDGDSLTKDQSRVYASVQAFDFSGGLAAKVSEDVALCLTGSTDKDDFEDKHQKGILQYKRATIRVRREVSDGKVRFSVVYAMPGVSSVPLVDEVPTDDARAIPTYIECMHVSPVGGLLIKIPSGPDLVARGALCVVHGSTDPDVEARDDGFGVKNKNVHPFPERDPRGNVHTLTIAPTTFLARFSLTKGDRAIAYVTSILPGDGPPTLVVEQLWKVSEDEIVSFNTEVQSVHQIFKNGLRTPKRSAPIDDTIYGFFTPSPKKVKIDKP